MSFQAQARVHSETFASYSWWISASTTLNPSNQVVHVNSAGGAVNVTLPDMAEAAGSLICVTAPVGATNDVSVLINETGLEVGSGGDLDANNDATLFYCTGLAWVPLVTTV